MNATKAARQSPPARLSIRFDDGKTYAYEKGDFHITDLHWDNAASKFTQKGSVARTIPDSQLVEVVGR
jgi:alpha-D-xyloside xylohydrolase